MRRRQTAWPSIAFDALRMGLEAQQVIALRLWGIASGTARGRREQQRMAQEKLGAFTEAAIAAGAAAMLGRGGPAVVRAGMRKLRRRVRANRSRLMR
jgi:hypothetical protein